LACCSRVKGFVLSPLPELGTMGSKWGGARVTGSSTSSRIWVVPVLPDECESLVCLEEFLAGADGSRCP